MAEPQGWLRWALQKASHPQAPGLCISGGEWAIHQKRLLACSLHCLSRKLEVLAGHVATHKRDKIPQLALMRGLTTGLNSGQWGISVLTHVAASGTFFKGTFFKSLYDLHPNPAPATFSILWPGIRCDAAAATLDREVTLGKEATHSRVTWRLCGVGLGLRGPRHSGVCAAQEEGYTPRASERGPTRPGGSWG